jgi:hypothetical protein
MVSCGDATVWCWVGWLGVEVRQVSRLVRPLPPARPSPGWAGSCSGLGFWTAMDPDLGRLFS